MTLLELKRLKQVALRLACKLMHGRAQLHHLLPLWPLECGQML